jgi:hypothetical protein
MPADHVECKALSDCSVNLPPAVKASVIWSPCTWLMLLMLGVSGRRSRNQGEGRESRRLIRATTGIGVTSHRREQSMNASAALLL